MRDRVSKGYGRAWTEGKAAGPARLLQILREPATTTTYYVLTAAFVVVMVVIEIWV